MNLLSQHRTVAVVVLGLLLALGAGIYLKMYIFQPVFKNDFEAALKAHIREDAATAIARFEDAYRRAPDKAAATRTAQYLVDNLFARGQGGDFSRAVSIAESVLEDQEAPPPQRALVLGIFAANVMWQDASFSTLYFTSDTMKKFLGGENSPKDRNNVAIRIFKEADRIYPTIYAKYRVTEAYYRLITSGGMAEGAATIDDMARSIQLSVAEGDKIPLTDVRYLPGSLAKSLYLRAIHSSYAGFLLNNMSTEQRELLYRDTLAKLSNLPQEEDPRIMSYILRTRFHYAGVLLDETSGREADIVAVLALFGTVDPTAVGLADANRYFQRVYKRVEDNRQKRRLMTLAGMSEPFKTYLTKLGLSF